MESNPAPHFQLTEEEIKEKICNLCSTIDELKDYVNEVISLLDCELYDLKRHFCPEKFTEVQMTLEDLESLS